MEKLLNTNDKEYMKMAMLKHEESFREQVNELHRLYRIQKTLMKDIAKTTRNDQQYGSGCNQPESRFHLDLERPREEFNRAEAGGKCRVSETDQNHDYDLELTLGSKSYYQRKTKAAEPGRPSDFGPSFSSSSTGSINIKRPRVLSREELLNQDRMNNPPWLFQSLSMNMTS